MNYKDLEPIGRRLAVLMAFPFMLVGVMCWIPLILPCWVLTGKDVDDQLTVFEKWCDKVSDWMNRK